MQPWYRTGSGRRKMHTRLVPLSSTRRTAKGRVLMTRQTRTSISPIRGAGAERLLGFELRHDVLLRGLLVLVLVAWWWVVPRSGLGHRTTRYVRHARGWYAYGVRTVRGPPGQAALRLWCARGKVGSRSPHRTYSTEARGSGTYVRVNTARSHCSTWWQGLCRAAAAA